MQAVVTMLVGQGGDMANSYMVLAWGVKRRRGQACVGSNSGSVNGVYPKRKFSSIGPHFPCGSIVIGMSMMPLSIICLMISSPEMLFSVMGSPEPSLTSFDLSFVCRFRSATAVTFS